MNCTLNTWQRLEHRLSGTQAQQASSSVSATQTLLVCEQCERCQCRAHIKYLSEWVNHTVQTRAAGCSPAIILYNACVHVGHVELELFRFYALPNLDDFTRHVVACPYRCALRACSFISTALQLFHLRAYHSRSSHKIEGATGWNMGHNCVRRSILQHSIGAPSISR